MKDEVGVNGGGDTIVLGTRQEVESFFETVNSILNEKDIAIPLITDRLYKRYIKQLENKAFLDNLLRLAEFFSEYNIQKEDYFIYLDKFKRVAEKADFNVEYFTKEGFDYKFQPVRIINSNVPYLVIQKKMPLEIRDNVLSALRTLVFSIDFC